MCSKEIWNRRNEKITYTVHLNLLCLLGLRYTELAARVKKIPKAQNILVKNVMASHMTTVWVGWLF